MVIMARKGQTRGPDTGRQGAQSSPGVQLAGQDQSSGSPGGNGENAAGRFSLQPEPELSPQEIAERAYQIFEREGRPDGQDQEHWFRAERELQSERARSVQSAPSSTRQLRPEEAPRSARQHLQSPAP